MGKQAGLHLRSHGTNRKPSFGDIYGGRIRNLGFLGDAIWFRPSSSWAHAEKIYQDTYMAMGYKRHNLCLHFGADEHPSTYFDAHQGYRVLTHRRIECFFSPRGSKGIPKGTLKPSRKKSHTHGAGQRVSNMASCA